MPFLPIPPPHPSRTNLPPPPPPPHLGQFRATSMVSPNAEVSGDGQGTKPAPVQGGGLPKTASELSE